MYYWIPDHNGKTRVFITDRNYRSYTSPYLNSHKGSTILVDNGKLVWYDVNLQVFSTCAIAKINHGPDDYTNCVENGIQNTVGKTLGCVPPWMSPNNHCNGSYPGNFTWKIPNFENEYITTVRNLKNNEIEKSCQNSCNATESTVFYRTEETDNYHIYSTSVSLTFEQQVKIQETVYSYNLYNFIIDVGSSLGLWFGLSVLNLNDLVPNMIELFRKCLSIITSTTQTDIVS